MVPADGPNPIKDAQAIMMQAQALDDESSQLLKKREALENHLKEAQKKLSAAEADQAQMKLTWEEQKKKRGQLELDVKAKDADIARHNSQLSDCKTNEAYTAKMHEIENAQKAKQQFEDEILQLMENEESLNQEFSQKAKDLENKTKEVELEAQEANRALGEIDNHTKELAEKKAVCMKGMMPTYRDIYARRHAQRPKVIAAVGEEQTCGGCSMKVPALQVTDLKKLKSFVTCQMCGVILVDPSLL